MKKDTEQFDVQFSKFNLKENDCLVVKVDISNLSEKEAVERLSSVRNDSFIKYVEEKGHKTFITYTGLNLTILRMEETDKLVAYASVDDMTEEEAKQYVEYIKFKIMSNISEDKLIVVPIRRNSPVLEVLTAEGENDGN